MHAVHARWAPALAGLALLLVTAVLTLGAAPATSAPVSTSTTASLPIAAKASPGSYKCGKWKNHGGIGWRWCANITSYSDKFKTDYTESQFNKFRKQTISFTCSQSKSKTWTYGGTATVEMEAGVIFAKAKTVLSANLSRSTTTTNSTSATYKIKPRKWAHCKRGTLVYTWSGMSKKQTCDSDGCVWSNHSSYTKHAPTRATWKIGPGRG